MNIVFLDVATPHPYVTVDEAPGGSEMTVSRIAHGLAARGHQVTVAQRARKDCTASFVRIDGPSVRFCPIDPMWVPEEADALVVLRLPWMMRNAARFVHAKKKFLWCHDFNHDKIHEYAHDLIDTETTVLAVSMFHRRRIEEYTGYNDVDYIYNPVEDDLDVDDTVVDPKKLLFAAAPHKGLQRAIEVFKTIRSIDPSFKLYVASPMYAPQVVVSEPGVEVLGNLTRSEVLKHIRSSLCLLHPNDVYEETFGIVHVEANAVGTPVAAIRHGATTEIMVDRPWQLFDRFDAQQIARRVISWSETMRGSPLGLYRFRLESVLDKWEEKLTH